MEKDRIIRAISLDGEHQLYVVRARQVLLDATAIRPLSKKASELLSNMMMLALLRSNNLKEASSLLTFQLDTVSDAKKIMATANSMGEVKGYIANPSCIGDLSSNMLSCTADLGMKTPYHSSIFVDGSSFENCVNSFFEQSDQTLIRFHSHLLFDDNGDFVDAVALLYHKLPTSSQDYNNIYSDARAEEALKKDTLEEIAAAFFKEEKFEIVSDEQVCFHCDCSKDKFVKLLQTVTVEELSDMASQKEPTVTTCGWCGKSYSFTPEEIARIASSKLKKQA